MPLIRLNVTLKHLLDPELIYTLPIHGVTHSNIGAISSTNTNFSGKSPPYRYQIREKPVANLSALKRSFWF